MATKTEQKTQAAFEIANLMDDAADALGKRSKRDFAARRISLDEYVEARARELELRAEVSVIVANGTHEALEGIFDARASIERAILDAKEQIDKVRSIEKGLRIVEAVMALAVALVAGDVQRVFEAGKSVSDLT